MNGFGGAQALVGDELALDALGFGTLQVQVTQTAQRLGAQRGIAGVQVEEAPVAVHGLVGVDVPRRIRIDVDLLGIEILDRRRFLLGSTARRREQRREQ